MLRTIDLSSRQNDLSFLAYGLPGNALTTCSHVMDPLEHPILRLNNRGFLLLPCSLFLGFAKSQSPLFFGTILKFSLRAHEIFVLRLPCHYFLLKQWLRVLCLYCSCVISFLFHLLHHSAQNMEGKFRLKSKRKPTEVATLSKAALKSLLLFTA